MQLKEPQLGDRSPLGLKFLLILPLVCLIIENEQGPQIVPTHRSLRIQFDKGNSREETLLGKNYHVVPCVAMVQGVRFGAGQSDPELGLASEFGNNPIMWANRPLVLNHPKVGDTFVSANTPDILNKYQFGITMNPQVIDDKLKLEAWIDKDRVTEAGGDFSTTFNRVQAEEDVEVSVGFFTDVEKVKGQFNGQEYGGVWRNVRPDHLAVLTEGLIGACSVSDGCGMPRVNLANQSGDPKMPELKLTGTQTIPQPQPQTQCSCGGAHTQEDHVDPADDNKPVTQGGLKKMLDSLLKPFTQTPADKAVEAHSEGRELNEMLVSQVINTSLMDKDIRAMISRALNARPNSGYVYLLGYTQDVAIYEDLDMENYTFKTYQLGINVNDSSVEFVGDPQEVLLQTKIVPQGATASEMETTTVTTPTTQETNMANEQQAAASAGTKAQDAAVTTEAAKPPVTQAAPPVAPEAPKVQTMEQYLSTLPPEMRENVTQALAAQERKKTGLIKTLMDAKQNKFAEDYLKTQSVEILENMVALLPGTYAGVSQPANPRFQAGGDAEGRGETVPVPKIDWNPNNHANGTA